MDPHFVLASVVASGFQFRATMLSIMAFSIMALIIMGLDVTLSITDTLHNNTVHYAECRYAECQGALSTTERTVKICLAATNKEIYLSRT